MRLFEGIKEAAEAAATSTDNQDEENRCLNAFKLLKIFLVDFGFLEASQIGNDMRVLTKHPSKKIQACATDLLKLLKFLDKCEIRKNKKQKVYHKVSRVEKKYKNGISHSRNEKIKVPYSDVPDAVEKNVSTLKKASSSPIAPSKQKTVAKTNDETRDKIREFAPKQIVNMRTEDMASDGRKKETEKIRMKDLFECEHGHKRKAMLIHSVDEPMTTHVTCVSCD